LPKRRKGAYGHDDENHLRILPRLHECLSSSITESNFDTSQVETRVLLDDLGFFVGDGTSTLDEDGHELGDEVFCKLAKIHLLRVTMSLLIAPSGSLLSKQQTDQEASGVPGDTN